MQTNIWLNVSFLCEVLEFACSLSVHMGSAWVLLQSKDVHAEYRRTGGVHLRWECEPDYGFA